MDDRALADWLSLREPVDAVSRSDALTRTIAAAVAGHDPLRVLDLASGRGANIRYLAGRLPGSQEWLAADRSAALLAHVPGRVGPHVIETTRRDLNDLEPDLFAGRHLVTASALLDLVSERWLRALAARCREAGAAALFTITYNGRSACTPAEPDDDLILEFFNQHQRTDKGLGGPAAGPDAAAYAVRAFQEAGYQVQSAPSDWTLGSSEAELQRQLIDGWALAAAEVALDAAPSIAEWRVRRLRHVEEGRSRLVVGHDDVAAWLRGT
jgi:hypothetical protein